MIKQVIVLRKDLNMRKGKMCAQASHAFMKIFFDRAKFHSNEHGTGLPCEMRTPLDKEMEVWAKGTFAKIVLGVESEEELLQAYADAQEAGLPCALITDVGRTEFHGEPTNTAIAIGPAKAEDIDPITGSMKLL